MNAEIDIKELENKMFDLYFSTPKLKARKKTWGIIVCPEHYTAMSNYCKGHPDSLRSSDSPLSPLTILCCDSLDITQSPMVVYKPILKWLG